MANDKREAANIIEETTDNGHNYPAFNKWALVPRLSQHMVCRKNYISGFQIVQRGLNWLQSRTFSMCRAEIGHFLLSQIALRAVYA